jgi:hypothetical protein
MLGNNTLHENEAILQSKASDESFDIIFLDVWSPGDGVLSKDGKHKSVTMTDCLTGFTNFAFTNESKGFNAEDTAELVFKKLLCPTRNATHGRSCRQRPVCRRVSSNVRSATDSVRSSIESEPQGQHLRTIPQATQQGPTN